MPNIRVRRNQARDSEATRYARAGVRMGLPDQRDAHGFDWDCPLCFHLNTIQIAATSNGYASNMDRFLYPEKLTCESASCRSLWGLRTLRAVVGSTTSLYEMIGTVIPSPDATLADIQVFHPTVGDEIRAEQGRRQELHRQMTAPMALAGPFAGPPESTDLVAALSPPGFRVFEDRADVAFNHKAVIPYAELTLDQQAAWLEATGKKMTRMQLLLED